MIREALWRIVAFIVTQPAITDWLIARAQRTPYTHIHGPDGSLYMGRWWLFNPYAYGDHGANKRWGSWLPSVRIHHIIRPDSDRHLHDHPWNARTIVLRGFYAEERPHPIRGDYVDRWGEEHLHRQLFSRARGYTGRLLFGHYHRINTVSDGGVWTLFITWKKQGTWGFNVNGRKVPWREYLGIDKPEPAADSAAQP